MKERCAETEHEVEAVKSQMAQLLDLVHHEMDVERSRKQQGAIDDLHTTVAQLQRDCKQNAGEIVAAQATAVGVQEADNAVAQQMAALQLADASRPRLANDVRPTLWTAPGAVLPVHACAIPGTRNVWTVAREGTHAMYGRGFRARANKTSPGNPAVFLLASWYCCHYTGNRASPGIMTAFVC